MVVYSNAYCSIEWSEDQKLLQFLWSEKSKELTEETVKQEIEVILEYVKKYSAINVLIDARHYTFQKNEAIQFWINNTFMPLIIDAKVKKYAIIFEYKITPVLDEFHDSDELEEDIQVEYFTTPEEALHWINS
jgi:hypothetical protein